MLSFPLTKQDLTSVPSVVQARTRQLTNQSAKTESDDEPIEWGDMDPTHRELLQHNPEALQAFKLRSRPPKATDGQQHTKVY